VPAMPSTSLPAAGAVLNIANGATANGPENPLVDIGENPAPAPRDQQGGDTRPDHSDALVPVPVNGPPRRAPVDEPGDDSAVARSDGGFARAEGGAGGDDRDPHVISDVVQHPLGSGADNVETRFADPISSRRHEVAAQRRDVAAAALGEKLLQGWTMLQDACARCSTPLLRDSIGTLLCVTCNPHPQSRDGTGPGLSDFAGGRQVNINNSQALEIQRQDPTQHRRQALPLLAGHAPLQPDTNVRAQLHSQPLNQDADGRFAPHQMTDIVSGPRGQLNGQQFTPYNLGAGTFSDFRLASDRPLLQAAPNAQHAPAARIEAPVPTAGLLTDERADGNEAPQCLNVEQELVETEQAIAGMLRVLRARLHSARDVESARAACVAIQAAADAITAIRQAASSVS
jgi:uncharacterized Zn finger protein (UPF0148 family)